MALLAAGSAAAQNAPPVKPGFPLDIPGQTVNQAAPIGSQVLAADLGLTVGFKSIILGLRNGKLYVVKRSGTNTWAVHDAPGAATWPQQLPAHVYSSPAVADVNNNGTPDIVVGYGSTFDTGSHGGLRAYDRDGNLLWEVLTGDVTPGPANNLRDPVMSTPAIGDVDGDGTLEVVFGALDHQLYVVNGENGLSNNAAIWPKDMQDTVFSSPALHDIDGDGRLDIVVGTDSFMDNGGRLRVLRFDGTEVAGFPKIIDQVVSSSPVVGDIDGDGQPEIVHGTGTFFTDANNGSRPAPLPRIHAWNCDGSPVAGWPVATSGQVTTTPALANLDADATLEVVVTDSDPPGGAVEHRLYAFNGNGSQVFAPVVVRDFFGQSLSAGEPVIGDVLANAGLEILVPTNGEVAIFSAAGTQLTETDNFPDDPAKANLMTQDSLGAVAVTNLETGAASPIEVIAVSARDFPDQTITVVHVWNPNAANTSTTPPWGFFHQNERRTGVAPGTGSCPGAIACSVSSTAASFFTVPPCRLVDTRNAGQGPALLSGASRLIQVGGVCGVPANAKAVSVNATITQPTNLGHVTLAPAGCAVPNVSTINFSGGQTRANNGVVALSSGALTVHPFVLGSGSVHLILDVTGYFQ